MVAAVEIFSLHISFKIQKDPKIYRDTVPLTRVFVDSLDEQPAASDCGHARPAGRQGTQPSQGYSSGNSLYNLMTLAL